MKKRTHRKGKGACRLLPYGVVKNGRKEDNIYIHIKKVVGLFSPDFYRTCACFSIHKGNAYLTNEKKDPALKQYCFLSQSNNPSFSSEQNAWELKRRRCSLCVSWVKQTSNNKALHLVYNEKKKKQDIPLYKKTIVWRNLICEKLIIIPD